MLGRGEVTRLLGLAVRSRVRRLGFVVALAQFVTTLPAYADVLEGCSKAHETRRVEDVIKCFEELTGIEAIMLSMLDEMIESLNEEYNAEREILDWLRRAQTLLKE